MAFPTSGNWDRFYWDESTISALLSHPDVYTGGSVTTTTDGHVLLSAVTGYMTSYVAGVFSGGDNFWPAATFEVEFKFTKLPDDPQDADNYNLIGVETIHSTDKRFIALGFGSAAICLVGTDVGDPLPGSPGLVQQDVWYRGRWVYDAEAGEAYFYLTRVDELISGQVLRWKLTNIPWYEDTVDSFGARIDGTATKPVELELRMLRGAGQALYPTPQPQPRITTQQVISQGQYVVLDGRQSEDVGDSPSYRWSVDAIPLGSSYRFDGQAETRVNPRVLYFSQPVDQDLTAGDKVVIQGYGETTIAAGSIDPSTGTSVSLSAVLVEDEIVPANTSNLAVSIYKQSIIPNRTSVLSYATPDVPGRYDFSLTITNNGVVGTATAIVQVEASLLAEASPIDLSWLWRMIGDQWELVRDKEKIESIWEAFSLAASSALMNMWQINASKSLDTIPRQYVLSWVRLKNKVLPAVSGEPEILGDSLPVFTDATWPKNLDGKVLSVALAGNQADITFSGTSLQPGDVVDAVNQEFPGLASEFTDSGGNQRVKFESVAHFELSGSAVTDLGVSHRCSCWSGQGTFESDGTHLRIASDYLDFEEHRPSWMVVEVGDNPKLFQVASVSRQAVGDWLIGLATSGEQYSGTVDWHVCPVAEYPTGVMDFDKIPTCTDDYLVYQVSGTDVHNQVVGWAGRRAAMLPKAQARGESPEYRRLEKRNNIPVFDQTVSVPKVVSAPESAEYIYHEGEHFVVESDDTLGKYVRFFSTLPAAVDNWWAPRVFVSSEDTVYDNFGALIGIEPDDLESVDYLTAIKQLWYALVYAPIYDAVEASVHTLLDYPVVEREGTIVDIQQSYTSDLGRVLVYDEDAGVLVPYFYPGDATLATNPDTGEQWQQGDTVTRWSRLVDYQGIHDFFTDGHGYLSRFGKSQVEEIHSCLLTVPSELQDNLDDVADLVRREKPAYVRLYAITANQIDDRLQFSEEVIYNGHLVLNELVGLVSWSSEGAVPVMNDHDGGHRYRDGCDDATNPVIIDSEPDDYDWYDPSVGATVSSSGYIHGPGQLILLSRPIYDVEALHHHHLVLVWEDDRVPLPKMASFLLPFDDDKPMSIYLGARITAPAVSTTDITIDTTVQRFGAGCAYFDASSGTTTPNVTVAGAFVRWDVGVLEFHYRLGAYDGDEHIVRFKSGSTTVVDLQMIQDMSGDGLKLTVRDSAGNLHYTYKTGIVTAGTWYHMVLLWNENTVWLQMDGTTELTVSTGGNPIAQFVDLVLGLDAAGATPEFYLDQMVYYPCSMVCLAGNTEIDPGVHFASETSIDDVVAALQNTYGSSYFRSYPGDRVLVLVPGKQAIVCGSAATRMGFRDASCGATVTRKGEDVRTDDFGIKFEVYFDPGTGSTRIK